MRHKLEEVVKLLEFLPVLCEALVKQSRLSIDSCNQWCHCAMLQIQTCNICLLDKHTTLMLCLQSKLAGRPCHSICFLGVHIKQVEHYKMKLTTSATRACQWNSWLWALQWFKVHERVQQSHWSEETKKECSILWVFEGRHLAVGLTTNGWQKSLFFYEIAFSGPFFDKNLWFSGSVTITAATVFGSIWTTNLCLRNEFIDIRDNFVFAQFFVEQI